MNILLIKNRVTELGKNVLLLNSAYLIDDEIWELDIVLYCVNKFIEQSFLHIQDFYHNEYTNKIIYYL